MQTIIIFLSWTVFFLKQLVELFRSESLETPMLKQALVLMIAGLASVQAMAAADCKDHPESEWMQVLDMQKKIVNEYGFAIKKFKIDGNCYEIYGWGQSDKGNELVKIEVYFDPKTGEIVKKKFK